MKKSIIIFLSILNFQFLIFNSILAQAPQAFKYQAIARDNTGAILSSTTLSVRISIHDATALGTVIYKESFLVTTNQFGLFTLNIGTGTVLSGTFNTISWGVNNKFVQYEVDFGAGYMTMGTSQLLSVPYALYAETSGTGGAAGATGATGATGNNGINGTNGATGATGNNGVGGVTGATGATGTVGTSGMTGATGSTGSNGSTGATGASGTVGQMATSVFGTAQLIVSAATYTQVPGLTQTLTIPGSCSAIVSTFGGVAVVSTATTAYSAVRVGLYIDGAIPADGGIQNVIAMNSTSLGNVNNNWSFQQVVVLSAGVHTIDIRAALGQGTSAYVSDSNVGLLQGGLTVMILKN